MSELTKSKIVKFYSENGKDHRGRTYNDIMNFPNKEFDECHDFIQWLFPLHEASRMTMTDVPLITPEDFNFFKNDKDCQDKIFEATMRYAMFLSSLGQDNWCKDGDHNLLRITRIIRSLRFFGMKIAAHAFYLDVVRMAKKHNINQKTLDYWSRALNDDLFSSLY
jgi:hypothetical protein